MPRILEKVERRLGEKLFLKGERCAGPKCAAVRRAFPPGSHGKGKGKGRKRAGSDFSLLLREKQRTKYFYGLDEREVSRYSKDATAKGGVFSAQFLRLIESRLDNAVFRLGFGTSRRGSRQLVGHGHILVNGKMLNIPSYIVRKGDIISVKEKIIPSLGDLAARLKRQEAPAWLKLDPEKKTGEVVRLPDPEDTVSIIDTTKVKEFYSR